MSAINSLFGSNRNELAAGSIKFSHRDKVRTLLSLLDHLPEELVIPPFSEFTEYLQCRSALISALSIWDIGDQDRTVHHTTGRDPIEHIRRILATCPDENPPPSPELIFIPDALARATVQEHIQAAWVDFRAGEWNGATVFAAAAVEALLFWALKGHAQLKAPDRLEHQHLRDYIDEAMRLSVISEETAQQASLAIDGRNLIHAGKVARTGLACNKATALTALAALEVVMNDLV